MSNSDPKHQIETLRKIINGAHTAFLVTHNAQGRPHGRPMATAELKENVSELWFAAEKSSGKIAEIAADNRVFLGYASHSSWATINGRAQVVEDRAKIRELWSPIWKNYFSGPDDPELTLIRVQPEDGEYWAGGSSVVTMAKLAFTALTGKSVTPGDHEHVSI